MKSANPYYYTYCITNTINNKYYYGFHVSKSLDDDYLGSGVAIRKAVSKYGRSAFIKEIVSIYWTYDDLLAGEAKLITQDIVDDPMSYNMRVGGKGGSSSKEWTEERRKKSSERAYREGLPFLPKTAEWNQKNREAHLGKKHSEERKQKNREAQLKYWTKRRLENGC